MAPEAWAARHIPPEVWPAADRVPTLTEVVELDSVFPATQVPFEEPGMGWAESGQAPASAEASPAAAKAASASALSAEVLFELEQRIGTVLEARLREALAPALARAADALITEARRELAQTLRELVDESVTRALERRTQA